MVTLPGSNSTPTWVGTGPACRSTLVNDSCTIRYVVAVICAVSEGGFAPMCRETGIPHPIHQTGDVIQSRQPWPRVTLVRVAEQTNDLAGLVQGRPCGGGDVSDGLTALVDVRLQVGVGDLCLDNDNRETVGQHIVDLPRHPQAVLRGFRPRSQCGRLRELL